MRKRTRASSKRREEREPDEPVRDFEIAVPFDAANEQVVLGAMMVDETACDALLARAPIDAFQVEDHKILREAIGEARRMKLGLDPATLARLRPALDMRMMEDLVTARPDGTPNLDFHVKTLKLDWVRAQATRGPLQALLDLVQDPTADIERIRAVARQIPDAFGSDGSGVLIKDRRDVLRRMKDTLRRRQKGEAWYPYGIEGLDFDEEGKRRHRPGMAPGMITVLTARSGGGKSFLAGHIIRGQARAKRRILVGAWEIEDSMTTELLATMDLGWSRSKTLDGFSSRFEGARISDDEIDELYDAGERITEYATFVENPYKRRRRGEKREYVEDRLEQLAENIRMSGAEVVVLDLYDRMLDDRAPDAEQEAMLYMLDIVKETKVHLIIVHQQLLKGKDVRSDKKPSIEGLKGSSTITDNASLIIAPHIPALVKNVPNDTFEIHALKGRYVHPFAVEFGYNPETGALTGGRTIRADMEQDDVNEAFGMSPPNSGRGAPRSGRGFNKPSVQRSRR